MGKIGEEDANKGIEIAHMLRSYYNRKVLKSAVMASVYGISGTDSHRLILNNLSKLRDSSLVFNFIFLNRKI